MAEDLSFLYIVEIKTADGGGQTRRIDLRGGNYGIEKEGRAIETDVFLPVTKSDRLTEVVFLCLGVARENSVLTVFGADIVEEEISMGRFIVCPTAEADPSSVARAAVGGDEIGSGVAFDLLIPDVYSRAVAMEFVSEDDVVFDRLLDKDPVAAVGGAGVE